MPPSGPSTITIALSGSDVCPFIPLWVLLCGAAFVIFVVFSIRPLLMAMANHSLEDEPVKEVYICVTLTLVLACSFVADAIGIHPSVGLLWVVLLFPKKFLFWGVDGEDIRPWIWSFLATLFLCPVA